MKTTFNRAIYDKFDESKRFSHNAFKWPKKIILLMMTMTMIL